MSEPKNLAERMKALFPPCTEDELKAIEVLREKRRLENFAKGYREEPDFPDLDEEFKTT
ncbi:MAG: hypothetical protein ACOYMG_22635 [Candidatus Methylumidiphilus sp.]